MMARRKLWLVVEDGHHRILWNRSRRQGQQVLGEYDRATGISQLFCDLESAELRGYRQEVTDWLRCPEANPEPYLEPKPKRNYEQAQRKQRDRAIAGREAAG